MTPSEEEAFRNSFFTERDRCSSRRLKEFKAFCDTLHVAEDSKCTEPLFSLQAYNAFFVDVVYVVRDIPSGHSNTWPFLRCTCVPFSHHAPCEHVEYARTLDIPNMKDAKNSAENLPEPTKKGRPPGSQQQAGKSPRRSGDLEPRASIEQCKKQLLQL